MADFNLEKTISTQDPEGTAVPNADKPKRRGRKPRTEEQKKAAAKKRAARKMKSEGMKPAVLVQYQDVEVDVDTLVETVKADFRKVKKQMPITSLELYIKPEERTAYYVVNGEFNGKLPF